VLIVGEQGLLADGLRLAFERWGLHVAGIAGSCSEGLRILEACQPDVVVLDLEVVDGVGVLFAEQIRQRNPATRVIGLCASGGVPKANSSSRKAFHSMIGKEARAAGLLRVTRAAAAGKPSVQPRLTFSNATYRQGSEASFRARQLTDREREILRLLADGLANEAIAKRLWISVSTVRTHVQTVLWKLHVHSRLAAVVYAANNGLV
jgi:DNA-binding NarL/FixJ family response regulator